MAPSISSEGDDNVMSFCVFIDKYDKEITGIEQLMLSIVGEVQLSKSIVSFGDILGNNLHDGLREQIGILKDAMSNIDIHDYSMLPKFFDAIGEYCHDSFHRMVLLRAIEHRNFMSAGSKLFLLASKEYLNHLCIFRKQLLLQKKPYVRR